MSLVPGESAERQQEAMSEVSRVFVICQFIYSLAQCLIDRAMTR